MRRFFYKLMAIWVTFLMFLRRKYRRVRQRFQRTKTIDPHGIRTPEYRRMLRRHDFGKHNRELIEYRWKRLAKRAFRRLQETLFQPRRRTKPTGGWGGDEPQFRDIKPKPTKGVHRQMTRLSREAGNL